jgi:parallel beta-helix repeat protein
MFKKSRIIALGATLVILAAAFVGWFSVSNGQIGLAQGGKTITVCATGCDFSKIQAAIDAAPTGATIAVQTGSYKENLTIRNKDGLTLKGAGPDQVTLDGNGPNQQNITPGILILSSRNVTVTGFKITNSRRGLEADDTTLLFIEGNTFEKNLRSGIQLTRSQAEVKGNIIQGTQVDLDASNGVGIALAGSQGTLSDNTITDNADCGIRAQSSDSQPSQISGGNNAIQNNKSGDLCGAAPLTLLAQPLPEGTLDQVTVPTDAATVQEAISKVKAGGTITLGAGTYKEQVQIYKSVTIRGAAPDQTVVQAPSIEYVAINIATDQLQGTLEGFKVTGGRRGMTVATGPAGNVTLRNVKIEANGVGRNPTNGDAGIWIYEQATATLDTVSITGSQGVGLMAFGRAKVTIQKSTVARNVGWDISIGNTVQATISNNQITGAKPSGDALGYGILAVGDSRVTAENNTISQNAGFGVYLWERTVSMIRQNTISDNENFGVYVRGSASVPLEDNTIARNRTEGIRTIESSKVTILNNRITGQRSSPQGTLGRGISAFGDSQLTIRDNTISANVSIGVDLYDRVKATVTSNTISGNNYDGIAIDWPDTPNETVNAEISSNTIRDNQNCGVRLRDNDPGTTITGQGNMISGNVKGQLCGTTSKFPAGFGGGK